MGARTYQINYISIVLNGDFDALAVTEIRPLFDRLAERETTNVLVDMADVSFIDSSGIGALVFLYKRMIAKGRQLILAGANGQPQQIMGQLRIDQTIQTYGNIREYLLSTGDVPATEQRVDSQSMPQLA